MIKQVFIEYWLWEDYNSGFYNQNCSNEKEKLLESVKYMKDHDKFKEGMKKAVFNWSNSMLNNLTNHSMNKIAYIGQCSNCIQNKIPSYVTKKAWKELSEEDMKINNFNALDVFDKWKKVYYPKLIDTRRNGNQDVTLMGFQTKLNLL